MRRLSGPDAWFLYSERPTWPMHVGALCILEPCEGAEWGMDQVRTLLAERLPSVPEFTMKLKEVPLGLDRPLLVRDPDFDIDRHLHRLGVPSPGGPGELADLVAMLAETPLDRRRPLWDIWVIEGLAGGRSALFVKTHHALVDGVSGVGLAGILADVEPGGASGSPPVPIALAERVPGDLELLGKGALHALTSPLFAALWAVGFIERTVTNVRAARSGGGRTAFNAAPRVPFTGTLGPDRRFAFASVPLEAVKKAKDLHGVKVNDVVLALAAGAVRRWLAARGALPAEPVVASVPMSLRADGDEEHGTKLVTLYASLETHIADPVVRLHAIADGMESAKGIGNVLKARNIRRLSDTVIPSLAGLGWRIYQQSNVESVGLAPSNLVVSNVPGATVPIYVAGARVASAHPVPPLVMGQGLNITVMSYLDSLDVGFICDWDMIEDPWELVEGFQDSLHELVGPRKRARSRPRRDTGPVTRAPVAT